MAGNYIDFTPFFNSDDYRYTIVVRDTAGTLWRWEGRDVMFGPDADGDCFCDLAGGVSDIYVYDHHDQLVSHFVPGREISVDAVDVVYG